MSNASLGSFQPLGANRATKLIGAQRAPEGRNRIDYHRANNACHPGRRPNEPGYLRLRFSNARTFFGHAAR